MGYIDQRGVSGIADNDAFSSDNRRTFDLLVASLCNHYVGDFWCFDMVVVDQSKRVENKLTCER